ncbi:FMNH2-dependent monooxygenase, partial [Mycobacterium sp. ITM-2017-0098]
IAWATGVEGMKEYRADIRKQAAAAGRDPDDVKVMFLFSPILGETEAEARAKIKPMSEEEIPARLKALSSNFYADF